MFLGNKSTILSLAKKMGYSDKIEIVKMTETNENYILNSTKEYMGFSKKTISKNFVEQFSKVITQMKEEGVIEAITKKYY